VSGSRPSRSIARAVSIRILAVTSDVRRDTPRSDRVRADMRACRVSSLSVGFTVVPPRSRSLVLVLGRSRWVQMAPRRELMRISCGTMEPTRTTTPQMKRHDGTTAMTNFSTARDGRSRCDASSREGSRRIQCRFRAHRPDGRDASTSTAIGFRLRATQPGCGRAGTTLNLDTDEVYRWWALCSSPPGSRDARGRRVRNTHRAGRADRTTARAPLSSELWHYTACPRPKPSAVEATWAQPLSRGELS
jgi:hypothetical protein